MMAADRFIPAAMPESDPTLTFVDEPDAGPAQAQAAPPWRVLVVDDDPDVHQATRFALDGQVLLGRPLELLSAYSAAEARALAQRCKDLALILLDVVMETEAAGLALVAELRAKPEFAATRIVLRTGQPGYAPEHESVLRYDINDYRSKTELTHRRLLTTVVTALRSYQQIRTIEDGRRGLELIVQSGRELMDAEDLQVLADGVLERFGSLLGSATDALVCAGATPEQAQVAAAAGRYATLYGLPLADLPPQIGAALLQAVQDRRSVACKDGGGDALYLGAYDGQALAIWIAAAPQASSTRQPLLQALGSHIAALVGQAGLLRRLRRQAYADPLLGLPNRTRLIELIGEALDNGSLSALALLDVDDFGATNDLMGHAYGDAMLRAYAQRLQTHFGARVVVSRMNSNTFGLLGPAECIEPQQVAATVAEPLIVQGQPQQLSVTSAFATLVPGVQDGSGWLKDVSIALKHAKRHERGRFTVFTPSLGQQARSRARLLSDLQAAFAATRLFVVYQPQLELASGGVVGMEALLRWRTEDGRLVPPAEFIPVAEQSGLILPLGDWVLDCACLCMRTLAADGLAPPRVAVNVSVAQFQQHDFVARVLAALDRHQLPAAQLELEITESLTMLGLDTVGNKLTALRAEGVSVALDDFGTGYSSLSYLAELPIDRLKIDRSFVHQIETRGESPIAEMITSLGHRLGLRTIAEGIETAAVAQRLQALGVAEGQGFWFARPLADDALREWLQAHAGGQP